MLKDMAATVYVPLIEGVKVLVPCKALHIEQNKYKIIETEQLDLAGDATSIWEFFPGDTVECKEKDDMLVATKLIDATFPDRKMHQLIFKLVNSFGNLSTVDRRDFADEIKILCNAKSKIKQKEHPIIKKWLHDGALKTDH